MARGTALSELVRRLKLTTSRSTVAASSVDDLPHLKEALRFADWRHVTPGTTIMRDGDPGNFFCFVADGELAVSKNGTRLTTLTAGECFGEMAIIRRHSHFRSADVVAESAANIVTIRGEALERASESCRMHFYQAFLDVLATRLALSNQRVAAI